jgi:hypothetical protein
MRPILWLVLLASAACVGHDAQVATALPTTGGSTSVHTLANPAASFDQYRTFSFGPPEGPPVGYRVSPPSAEVQRRLQPLIAAALQQRGYVPATGKGDILIMFGSGRREESIHTVSDVRSDWAPDDENADFVEGSLVIDAFDGAKAKKVWHGASRANIDPDRIDDQRLQRSVEELISSFPAASTTGR